MPNDDRKALPGRLQWERRLPDHADVKSSAANYSTRAQSLVAGFLILLASYSSLSADKPKPSAPIAYGVVQNMDEDGAPEGFIYVDVLIHSKFFVRRVLVPYESAGPGAIIKIEMPVAGADARFLEVAATIRQRSPSCNWVDGEFMLYQGGVICRGWSYKSLLLPAK